jgi:hypothetical protein
MGYRVPAAKDVIDACFYDGWAGDKAPTVIFYVEGPWLSRLADLTRTGSH